MADNNTYLGVYATNELPSALGASLRPMVKRKRLWFVWEAEDGAFIVQPLNAIFEPMAEPKRISFREFESRYTPEPSCEVVPKEELSHEDRRSSERVSIADIERGEVESAYQLRADDPNLLRNWLNAPPPLRLHQGELSPVQQAELARIVEESLDDEPESRAEQIPQGEPLQEHELRSRFALGLLQIKQGNRKEGKETLEALISCPNVNPYDGQLVFSEFGLHLRRLGLVDLALKAHLRALEWMPNDERVHFNLARTYHDLNDVESAIQHLRLALELAPDFATASQFLLFLEGRTHS